MPLPVFAMAERLVSMMPQLTLMLPAAVSKL